MIITIRTSYLLQEEQTVLQGFLRGTDGENSGLWEVHGKFQMKNLSKTSMSSIN